MLPRHTIEPNNVSISIPWDSNTFRGFVGALCVTTIMMLLLPSILDVSVRVPEPERRSIPIELMFGLGDGTGQRKGNLSEAGRAVKGQKPQSPLEDAAKAAVMKPVTKTNPSDYSPGANVKPVKDREITAEQPSKEANQGSATRSVGKENGSDNGTGLSSEFGSGRGAGPGIGDIEWGGGGNRIVLDKKLPKYPQGVNTSAVIKLRFTVRPDGTISSIIPLQKGEPALEQAAIAALRQWRFNPLIIDNDMVGIIPFYFKVQ